MICIRLSTFFHPLCLAATGRAGLDAVLASLCHCLQLPELQADDGERELEHV